MTRTAPRDASLHGTTVVALHAHPDDEAIFTGLTIHRLTRAGARVVLVTATKGELGVPLRPLPRGKRIGDVRRAELEAAAARLGVARIVDLGHRDSGMPGWPGAGHRKALDRADAELLAHRVARIAESEGASALLHYDRNGIYGHPDHVAVHRIGARAAELAAVTSYEATVDHEYLHFTGQHIVEGDRPRAGRPSNVGLPTVEITTAVDGDELDLAAKLDAMELHASQIAPIDRTQAEGPYGLEWYVRRGHPGVLEALGNAHAVA